jgi:hypothetical protein
MSENIKLELNNIDSNNLLIILLYAKGVIKDEYNRSKDYNELIDNLVNDIMRQKGFKR